jgi:hypothetical protein
LVSEFIIFGAPARKSNSRIVTAGGMYVLGSSANSYVNIFDKQIKRLKGTIPAPLDNLSYVWTFEIWYSDMRSDASIELIFDLLEHNGIVSKDVTIRNYIVLAETLDKELPRCEIKVYKLKEGE